MTRRIAFRSLRSLIEDERYRLWTVPTSAGTQYRHGKRQRGVVTESIEGGNRRLFLAQNVDTTGRYDVRCWGNSRREACIAQTAIMTRSRPRGEDEAIAAPIARR